MFLRSLKEAADDRAEERKKRKIEKEKMKRRSRKYGQAQLKHSRRGIKSCFLAVCALFILVLIDPASDDCEHTTVGELPTGKAAK